MKQRGRKAATALAVVKVVPRTKGLLPPENLSPEQRAVWIRTLNAMPAGWFHEEHIPMLTSFCRHVCNADTLDMVLRNVKIETLLSDAGSKHYERLYKGHERETRAAAALATRMRLTQQSLIDNRVAGRQVARHESTEGKKPWDV